MASLTLVCASSMAPSSDNLSRVPVRRKSFHRSDSTRPVTLFLALVFVILVLLAPAADAAYLNFQNCLSSNIIDSTPQLLQFVPYNLSATFNTSDPNFPLNVTVYGNVTGLETIQPYPAPNDPQWSNPNDTVGKIVDLSQSNNKYTTLFTKFNVLTYTPYQAASRFCNSSIHGPCPLGPAFYVNGTDLARLPAFSIAHEMGSSYALTSFGTTLRVTSGDANAQELACVSATITPELGGTLRSTLRYLPLAILVFVGVATIFAAICSPWGSKDTFRWTSNYGSDEDLLRLVTPGFGDCLQYIQFILLTGSLTLNYPGFYQPVVSQVGWSALMFNESLVTHGNGTQSVVDGVYDVNSNGTYGLDRMRQLIGMTSDRDVWAGMIVWLVAIIAAVLILTQLGFSLKWLFRRIKRNPAEDLRSKNWPFTAGIVIRVVFNYFLLPLVSLSMFQLVIASQGPAYSVAIAAVLLAAVIAFAVRLLYLFSKTRTRSFLFDDLPTVLLWGPLYNTYCDEQAGFAFLPILITFIRGIAIGAVQASGIAQLVLLATCEIILALTLNAVRPFPSATSMNVYHTSFTMLRLIVIFLSIAFIPALGVTEGTKGWIGYAIFLLHAAALVFGFFLNAIQTVVEVAARMAGAGDRKDGGTATRGGLTRVFGMRQLSKRVPRHQPTLRHSMASGAVLLSADVESKSSHLEAARGRSLSASPTLLLNQQGGDKRVSQTLDQASPGGEYCNTTPSTQDGASTFSRALHQRNSGSVSPAGILGFKQGGSTDPYYRKPRRPTMDLISGTARKNGPLTSEDASKQMSDSQKLDRASQEDAGEGPSISRKGTPVPTPPGAGKDELDDITNELPRTKTDYAVREVDFYYRVRGPALSSGTRKLKTGPADPTGPVSSATGWFKSIFGGKTKEKGKGFEVVRSARAPPPGLMTPSEHPSTVQDAYHDAEEEHYHDIEAPNHELESDDVHEPPDPQDDNLIEGSIRGPYTDSELRLPRTSAIAPSLPSIDTGGSFELPSRVSSNTSKPARPAPALAPVPAPAVPLKSPRRTSSQDAGRLSALSASSEHSIPKGKETKKRESYWPAPPVTSSPVGRMLSPSSSGRLPFASAKASNTKSNRMSTGAESTTSSVFQTEDDIENQAPHHAYRDQHSSSALGAHAPDLRHDRPSSVGFVQQHRASDHIHHSPESSELAGSRAEFIGGAR